MLSDAPDPVTEIPPPEDAVLLAMVELPMKSWRSMGGDEVEREVGEDAVREAAPPNFVARFELKEELVICTLATTPGWEGGREEGEERPMISNAPPSPEAAEFEFASILSRRIELPTWIKIFAPPPLTALQFNSWVSLTRLPVEGCEERADLPSGEREREGEEEGEEGEEVSQPPSMGSLRLSAPPDPDLERHEVNEDEVRIRHEVESGAERHPPSPWAWF